MNLRKPHHRATHLNWFHNVISRSIFSHKWRPTSFKLQFLSVKNTFGVLHQGQIIRK